MASRISDNYLVKTRHFVDKALNKVEYKWAASYFVYYIENTKHFYAWGSKLCRYCLFSISSRKKGFFENYPLQYKFYRW